MTTYLPFILDKYGPRLNTSQLADLLGTSPAEIRNWISSNKFPIKTYKDRDNQRAPRFADARDVAEYLDSARQKAA